MDSQLKRAVDIRFCVKCCLSKALFGKFRNLNKTEFSIKNMNIFFKKSISIELIMTSFVVFFVGLFVVANYFFGFNLALYIVAMMVATLIVLKYPRSGLYAIILLTFVFERFFTLVPIVIGKSEYRLYPIDILLVAVILGIIVQVALGKLRIELKKIDLAIFAFIFFSIFYFFISAFVFKSDTPLAFSSSKNYAFYALLYFATFTLINSKEKLKDLASVVFAGGVAVIWFVFYGLLIGHGLWSDFTPLSTDGIRTLAFTHGFYLCMTLLAGLIYMAYKSGVFAKWLMILMPIWLVGIMGSMMRHLWISVFVSVMVIVFLLAKTQRERLRKFALRYFLIAIFVGVLASFMITLFPRSALYDSLAGATGMIGNRIISVTNTSGDESIVWRSAVWNQAVKQYSKSPIQGVGFGKKVSVEIGKYRDFVEVRNIHNSFLVLLVQMGIFGITFVGLAIFVLARFAFRNKFEDETYQMFAHVSLGILTLQMVAFMFQPYLEANLLGIFFWINLGVLRILYKKNSINPEKN